MLPYFLYFVKFFANPKYFSYSETMNEKIRVPEGSAELKIAARDRLFLERLAKGETIEQAAMVYSLGAKEFDQEKQLQAARNLFKHISEVFPAGRDLSGSQQ